MGHGNLAQRSELFRTEASDRPTGKWRTRVSVPLRVLIVEDSESDALLLVRELKRGGYDLTYERVDTAGATKAARERSCWWKTTPMMSR
jgi:hypothetical protein